jgi:transposase
MSLLPGGGHDVRLIPAQYVKAFLKEHKNDYRDAEATAEAAQRPTNQIKPLLASGEEAFMRSERTSTMLDGRISAYSSPNCLSFL